MSASTSGRPRWPNLAPSSKCCVHWSSTTPIGQASCREGRGIPAQSNAAVLAAVTYVAGMTDRYAFDMAVRHLAWPPERLPRGIDRDPNSWLAWEKSQLGKQPYNGRIVL